MIPYQLSSVWKKSFNDIFLILKLAIKLFFNNCPHFLNLKARYCYTFLCCFFNYPFVMHACIEVRLVCKIPIVTISELTKIIIDQTIIFSCTNACVAGNGNVEYVRFNLPILSSIAGSTNYNSCYLPVMTKIFYFL